MRVLDVIQSYICVYLIEGYMCSKVFFSSIAVQNDDLYVNTEY